MRSKRRGSVAAAAVAAAVFVIPANAAAQEQPARRMTLSEVVAYGLAHSPDLAQSKKGVDSQRARLNSSRARRLPTLSVDATLTYWDKEQVIDLALPGMEPPPGAEPLTVRDRLTTTTSGTAVLPLIDQIRIGALVAVERHGLDASEQDHSARRLEVAAGSASAYLGVLLARATSDIASSRERLVSAQLDRARVLQQGGVLGRVDVMRLEAALAAARSDAITAASEAASAEDALAVAIGLPDGTRVETVDNLPDTPGAPPMDPAEAVASATQRRPELRAARARAEQAHSGASAQWSGLLPSLSAFGTVQHNTGQGTFQPEDAWFVGLNLSWTVWDWLSTWNTYRAADHQASQADMAARRLGDQLRLDVRRKAREARAAYDSLGVARAGLSAAEEAFRIQEVRFGEGATTTTELLQAETEVAEARIGYATARHVYFLRLAALAQATGQLPEALLPTTGAR